MNLDPGHILGLAIASVVYSVIGLLTFLLCFYLVDKLTPGNLWQELVEKKNTAVAIFFGVLALGMSLIIASCLHG
jgi:putative membrane protein